MDPNANLKEQAELLAIIATGAQRAFVATGEDIRSLRRRLAELRAALTDWLHRGGFAPDWSRYPTAARYYGVPKSYTEYRAYQNGRSWAVALYSTLTGDRKDVVDTDLSHRSALVMARKLNAR